MKQKPAFVFNTPLYQVSSYIYYMKRLLFILFWLCTVYSNGQKVILYGETRNGGTYGDGTLFKYEPATNKDTVLVNFGGADGNLPERYLLKLNNQLYGVTYAGGNFNDGIIFSYNLLTGIQTTVSTFNNTNGKAPGGGLIMASNGLLYGAASHGGDSNSGVIFSYNPITGKDSTLFDFSYADGSEMYGNLLQINDSMLYGVTAFGGLYGNGYGVIFSFNINSGIEKVLFNFNDYDGFNSQSSLIKASNGLLYGMTAQGGKNMWGVLFSFNPATDSEKTVINFDSASGSGPFGDLLQASNGLLYGLTAVGSANNNGLAFSYNPITGKDSIIIEFAGLNNASYPVGGLVEDTVNHILYGMTSRGGLYNDGILFEYNMTIGFSTVLLNFNDSNGATPYGSLLLVYDTSTTGINEISENNSVKVFPNPSKGIFNLQANSQWPIANSHVEIYNVLGEKVFDKALRPVTQGQGGQAQGDYQINISSESSGVYFYRMISEKGEFVASGKLIIQ